MPALCFCCHCGTQFAVGDRFCMECGQSLDQVQPQRPAMQAAPAMDAALPVALDEWLRDCSLAEQPRQAQAGAGGAKKKRSVIKYLSFGLLKGSSAKVS